MGKVRDLIIGKDQKMKVAPLFKFLNVLSMNRMDVVPMKSTLL